MPFCDNGEFEPEEPPKELIPMTPEDEGDGPCHGRPHRRRPPLGPPPPPPGRYYLDRRGRVVTMPGAGFLPYASKDRLGGVKIGDGISVDDKGVISVTKEDILGMVGYASKTNAGLAQVGDGIEVDDKGVISITKESLLKLIGLATATEPGLVTLSDSTTADELDATAGVAATPAAVAALRRMLEGLMNDPSSMFEGLTPEELKKLLALLIKENGGLGMDEEGHLYVDFNKMPKDDFEALLRTLRIPIWIDASTAQWYVNCHTGSDDLSDPARGKSKEKPFKTVNACVRNLVDNYNVTSWTVYINIAGGTYNETLDLGAYSRTTGMIVFRPYTGEKAEIISSGLGSLIIVRRSAYRFDDMMLTYVVSGVQPYHTDSTVMWLYEGSSVTLNGCTLFLDFQAHLKDGVTYFAIGRIAYVDKASALTIGRGCTFKMSQKNGPDSALNPFFNIRYASTLTFSPINTEADENPTTLEGECSYVFGLSGNSIMEANTYLKTVPVLKGEVTKGKKYAITTGSGLLNAYAKTFLDGAPAPQAGTLDSSSWHV